MVLFFSQNQQQNQGALFDGRRIGCHGRFPTAHPLSATLSQSRVGEVKWAGQEQSPCAVQRNPPEDTGFVQTCSQQMRRCGWENHTSNAQVNMCQAILASSQSLLAGTIRATLGFSMVACAV